MPYVFFAVLLLASSSFAGPVKDFFVSIGDYNALAGILGVSILGLSGIIVSFRKAVTEVIEAAHVIKYTILKYKKSFNSEDYSKLSKEIDEALEAIADVMDKVRMKKLGNKLRAIIR